MTNPHRNGNTPSFTTIVHWLTGAYPEGLPAEERPALISVLASRLSPTQLHQALVLLTPAQVDPGAPRLLTRDDVDALVEATSTDPPTVDEQRRVASRLAAAGWPLVAGT